MSQRVGGVWTQPQSNEPSPIFPADHVLFSGAVLFPGAFDQLGCPLVIFPVAGQTLLSAALSKAEVVDFISYCLSQHNKTQKSSLVSVVADLREASAASTRFIAETLLLLEEQKRTVHTAYIVQPKRKDVLRMLGKLWSPSKSQPATFNKVLLKEVFELSNYIDRSQLMASLGGYLVYCHQSWAVFTKEMDAFEEHFGSVVKRLPGCLSSVQALSTRPLPNSVPELQLFCSSIETHFQQLQRELGLDDLLKHCKLLVEKLRSPDLDPHFQAMAGTALFTLHFSSMLQYHRRITATVQKVELLWQEVFSKARLQLHVLQMREAALQITEQIESLLQHKLQPYNIHMARDGTEADQLTSEFHSSVYTPAMSLVVAAEEVVCTLTEQMSNALGRERWLLDLHRLKDKLHSTVHLTLQTLQAVFKYHLFYNKAHGWYKSVLSENYLQELLSQVDRPRRSWGTLPAWRKRLFAFLKNSPPPDMEELVHLAHLSQVIPDKRLQQEGRQLSHRCMILRRMIMSSEPVPIAQIQVALQWQYELLQSSLVKQREHSSPIDTEPDLHFQEANPRTATHRDSRVNLLGLVTTTEGKQSSHSSFDSGFEGAGSSRLEGHTVAPDFVKQTVNQPQIQEDTASTLSDSGGFGSLGNSSRASVNIAPKATLNSLDFEIKVKRSAAHPTNPWLSLPDDDLENSYTVTITPKPSLEQKDSCFSFNSQKNKELCPGSPAAHPTAWALHTQTSLEDSELSPMTHVLSSTVTEPTDQATGEPSMLWDSYDLHEQYLDSTEGVSAPLKDWDIKEEENLTEVERTLERTDKILTEEECVLAQEVQLDVLLRSEVEPYPWLAWNNQMSLNELSKGNVVDLDQFGAKSQFETDLNLQPADWRAKPDLLTELKEVHALDQKILEENFKINQLRQEDCLEEVVQRNSDRLNVQNVRMQLTEEKLEQKTSENKSVRNCQVKKPKERATRVIRCSIMSRTDSEEDRALCNEALSVQSCSEVSHSKDELRQSCSSDPTQSKKTCMKLQDNTTHSPSEPPVSNKMVSSRNPAQSPSDVGVTPDCTVDREVEPGIERGACSQPIPKPRKKTLSLKKQTNQHSTHRSKYGSTLPVDTMDAYASSVNTEEASTPTVDKLNLVGRTSGLTSGDLTAEGTESGGALAENTEGEGVPTEGRGSTRTDTEDRSIPAEGGEVPTEGGSSTTAKDTEGRRSIPAEGGGMPTEDTEGKEGMPTEDTEGRGRTPAEDSESGDVPAENTEGVGVPTESRGSTPTNDTEGRSILTESGGVPTEGRGRTPTEDNEGRRISTEGGGSTPTDDTEGSRSIPAEGGGVPTEATEGRGSTTTEDTEGREGTPAEDTESGGVPAENTEVGVPTESRGSIPAEGGGGVPTEDTKGGGNTTAERRGRVPTEDIENGKLPTEETRDVGESSSLDPNVKLHGNHNNNNKRLQPEVGKQETHSDDYSDQTKYFNTLAANSCDLGIVLPICTPLYNDEKREEVKWSEEIYIPMIQDQLNINTTLPSDLGTSIILDTGSGLMKAGFADEDLPSVLFPTIIGVPKYEEIMNSSSVKDTYVGHEAQHMRGVLALRHPIKNGIIGNWDDMQRIWQHTFDLLRVDPGEHPVLLTEAPMNPLENKQRAMEIMFEFFGVPYSYVAMQAMLALYAAGRTTGVVLDSGDGVTHSVPVYEGYVLPHAVQRFPLAGADVTAHLTKLLQEQGVCMRTTAEQEIVREMKEKCCCVSLNYEVELYDSGSYGEASYTMPDGKIVTLGSERIRAPEILFKPDLIGRDHYGLHESVYKSILNCDLDLRRDFLGNVVLSGGNTLLPGLPERLESELSVLVPCEPHSSVRVCSPSNRDFSVWCGGTVLANLPTFNGLWISQSEYEEYGPQIVHRKCF